MADVGQGRPVGSWARGRAPFNAAPPGEAHHPPEPPPPPPLDPPPPLKRLGHVFFRGLRRIKNFFGVFGASNNSAPPGGRVDPPPPRPLPPKKSRWGRNAVS